MDMGTYFLYYYYEPAKYFVKMHVMVLSWPICLRTMGLTHYLPQHLVLQICRDTNILSLLLPAIHNEIDMSDREHQIITDIIGQDEEYIG